MLVDDTTHATCRVKRSLFLIYAYLVVFTLLFDGALWQVVYILDQVRALESEMLESLQLQGLDFKPQIIIVRTFCITIAFIISYT